ncbi:MAG: Uma2 family endonuclease [Myxococcales bacterium]|nr:Uma2 family endonuclease [Myxococcales bacterium]
MGSSARPGSLPAVDDHLVREDARAEILRGKLLMCPPASEPHGTRHFTLAYVLGAHVAPGFVGAVDMLTRTDHDSDFAPDASIFPLARDPSTGGRRLEVLAFEIAATQPLPSVTEKARALVQRGVRRVFCLTLKRGRVLEWSAARDAWDLLDPQATIEDECLSRPLPVAALLDATAADEAVARALVERRHPVVEAHIQEAAAAARRSALLLVLASRGLEPDPSEARAIEATHDRAVLDGWLGRAAVVTSVEELLRAPGSAR